MRCPICGNRSRDKRVVRCARCGRIYCLNTHRQVGGSGGGCHQLRHCPRCREKRAIVIGT